MDRMCFRSVSATEVRFGWTEENDCLLPTHLIYLRTFVEKKRGRRPGPPFDDLPLVTRTYEADMFS
jgi:hypothetical protein